MEIDRDASVAAVQTVADAMDISLMEAAEGIVKIVNEAMFGALRLVSVEQGHDPVSYTHLPSPRDRTRSRMPSSA